MLDTPRLLDGRLPVMGSNIVRMPSPITDEELELAEQSCRRLAERYRQGGPGFTNPSRAYASEKAAELEAIAKSICITRGKP